jgi:hypothetical protein
MHLKERRLERCGVDSTGWGYGSVAGSCETLGLMRGGNLLQQLSDHQLLKEESAHIDLGSLVDK